MGACCGCGVYAPNDKENVYAPIAADNAKKLKRNPTNEETNLDTEDWEEYKKMMLLIFYTFAGYQPFAKKSGLYMHHQELQRFLEIVNIEDSIEALFELIDSNDEDGKLTLNEFMDYFTNPQINVRVFQIKQHIQQQITWELLVKALKIFDQMDVNHSGKLEYDEFEEFGALIGLNSEETELLWNIMDADDSGDVDITELFEWFRSRLYQQKAQIELQKQPTITFNQSDTDELH